MSRQDIIKDFCDNSCGGQSLLSWGLMVPQQAQHAEFDDNQVDRTLRLDPSSSGKGPAQPPSHDVACEALGCGGPGSVSWSAPSGGPAAKCAGQTSKSVGSKVAT